MNYVTIPWRSHDRRSGCNTSYLEKTTRVREVVDASPPTILPPSRQVQQGGVNSLAYPPEAFRSRRSRHEPPAGTQHHRRACHIQHLHLMKEGNNQQR